MIPASRAKSGMVCRNRRAYPSINSFVGTLEPRKNLVRLIDAYGYWCAAGV